MNSQFKLNWLMFSFAKYQIYYITGLKTMNIFDMWLNSGNVFSKFIALINRIAARLKFFYFGNHSKTYR
jgi:hypothetical protein